MSSFEGDGFKAVIAAMPHGLDDLSDEELFGEGFVDNANAVAVRKTFKSGAVRDSTGKLRYDLIPYEHTREMAKVLTMGAAKYEANNWLKGIPFSELYASAERHKEAFLAGEMQDPESKLLHVSHILWNWMAIETMILRGQAESLDDLTAKAKEKNDAPAV